MNGQCYDTRQNLALVTATGTIVATWKTNRPQSHLLPMAATSHDEILARSGQERTHGRAGCGVCEA